MDLVPKVVLITGAYASLVISHNKYLKYLIYCGVYWYWTATLKSLAYMTWHGKCKTLNLLSDFSNCEYVVEPTILDRHSITVELVDVSEWCKTFWKNWGVCKCAILVSMLHNGVVLDLCIVFIRNVTWMHSSYFFIPDCNSCIIISS